MNTSHAPDAVEVTGLGRRFGSKIALNEVSLQVKRGRVFGLVGANGAGKTTLIKHLLGRLRAESGSVRVFGLDPVADPVGGAGKNRLSLGEPRPARCGCGWMN